MGNAFGKMTVHLLCSFIRYVFSDNLNVSKYRHRENLMKVCCNLFFSIMTAMIVILFAPDYKISKRIEESRYKKMKVRKIIKDILNVFNPFIISYTISVFMYAVEKASISIFLSSFLGDEGISRSRTHLIFFLSMYFRNMHLWLYTANRAISWSAHNVHFFITNFHFTNVFLCIL